MRVGGIPTMRATQRELGQLLAQDCRRAAAGETGYPKVVVSSNGAVIAEFHHDKEFRDLILSADLVDADGMSLVIATRIVCENPLQERVATTDFIHEAARTAIQSGLKFYFLGAKPGVADLAADRLRALYSGLQIVGVRHGYFSAQDEKAICEEIVASGADVLWLGLGSPRQEAFALRNRSALAGLTWIRTCGGLFDHYSGRFKRAPVWVQNIGMEWLHRTMREPRRLGKRYLKTNLVAAYYLATQTSDRV